MIKKLIVFLVGKLNPKEIENLIYLFLPKLTNEQKKNLAAFLVRAAVEGAVAGAMQK